MTAHTLLAAMSRHPSATENVSFIITGFLFVVVMLGLLAVITETVGFFFKRAEKRKASAAKAVVAAPAPQAVPVPEPSENPHLLPLIAAAVHTALKGRPHRIMNVQRKNDGWAQEGRRQIFSSHKVR